MLSSLAGRLIALMLMCILPLAAILFYNLHTLRQSQEQAAHEEAYRLGEVASLEMARIVGGIEDTLIAVSAAPIVRTLQQPACNSYMVRVAASLPQFAGIAVTDKEGIIRCLQNPNGIGISLADKDYFLQAVKEGRTVLGKFTRGRVSGSLVLPVAVPVHSDDGTIIGVVAGSIGLDWLEKRLTERRFSKNGSLTVADSDGTILARYPQPEKFVGTPIPEQFRHLVRAEAPGTTEVVSQDGMRRILAYFPPADPATGLYVSVGLSTAAEYSALNDAVIWGLVVTIAAIVLAATLAWLTARYSIRRPVSLLVATVEAWRHGKATARTSLTAQDGEFGIVGHAIDAFMDELVRERARSEVLMRELDHRVKNLLATVQVITRQSLKPAKVDPDIIKSLNARLSAMANAHSVLMKSVRNDAGFAELVSVAVNPFDNSMASPFRISGPDFPLGSTAALAFSMALHELCTNAAKYGALSADGKVEINWTIRRTAEGDVLIFNWIETGGPEVKPPETSGFGTLMVQRMLTEQLHGTLDADYLPEGLRLQFTVSLANLNLEAS